MSIMTVKDYSQLYYIWNTKYADQSQPPSQFKQAGQVKIAQQSPPQPSQYTHKQQESVSITNTRNIKKYPKSPALIKPTHSLFIDVPFQPPSQYLLDPSISPRRNHHKKGKSMDFQISGFPLFDVVQNGIKSKQSGKIKADEKYLKSLRDRNTVSQLKDYKNSPEKRQKDTSSHKQKSKKSKVAKVAEKFHRDNKKTTQKIHHLTFEAMKYKKHYRSASLHTKPNKHLTSINSNNIIYQQYKSLQLVNRRCKSSLKDNKNKNNAHQLKQIQSSLPFSSKVNSLYSNTTSLFCSKSQLEPFTKQTVRITTEEPEEISQIRKFESMALSREIPKLSESKVDQPLAQDSQPVQTELIINKYLQLFKTQLQVPYSPSHQTEQSLFMQLYEHENNKTDPMIELEYQAKQLVNEIPNIQDHSQKELEVKEKEIDEIIKLISNTDALGEHKKEQILTKIRKIVPIANIGSKQLEIPTEKSPQVHKASSITSSLVQSFPQTQNYHLYDLKTLDSILLAHESQLSSKLADQLQEVQNSITMTQEQREAEKLRLKKWMNMLIQQSTTTRLQLWKNFNVAKQILGGQINKLKNSELNKSNSQQVILKSPFVEQKRGQSPKREIKEDILLEQVQNQYSEKDHLQKIIEIQEKLSQSIRDNIITPISKADTDPLGSYKKFYSSRQEPSSQKQIHNLVLLQSSDKIQYDYEDESPNTLKSPSDVRILCEQSSGSESESDFTKHFALISPQLNYTHPFTTMTQEDKEDIFEFMFIDLCIELSQELRKGSIAFNRIQNFINEQKIRATKRKGIEVNYQTVKEYLTNFIQFVQSRSVMYDPIFKELDRPIGPTALELLGYIRPDPVPIQDSDIETPNILDISLYEHYDAFYLDGLKIQNYYEDQELECKRRLFLRNASHIFNKALFDSMNQVLDQKRPYGQWGEPFNWQITSRFQHHPTIAQKNAILSQCALTISSYTQYYCGLIPDKQDFRLTKTVIPEAHVDKLRNERLFRFLTDYLEQLEDKLQFIEDDKTQLLVMISDWLWEQLLSQITLFFLF